MKKEDFVSAVQKSREKSIQRKFKQSFEIAINFKNIDFKKAENRIDVNVSLPYNTGKGSSKVALFANDQNFISLAKGKVAQTRCFGTGPCKRMPP